MLYAVCVSGIRRAALHFVYKMQATTTTIVLLLSLQINRLICANCGHDKAKQQTVRLTEWLTNRLIDRLTDWMIGRLCDCLTDWMTAWLAVRPIKKSKLDDAHCDNASNRIKQRTSYVIRFPIQKTTTNRGMNMHTHTHAHTLTVPYVD